jgi:hypothetical protein
MLLLDSGTSFGSLSIPAGETAYFFSAQIPANVPAGEHTVAAMVNANDKVSTQLHVQ